MRASRVALAWEWLSEPRTFTLTPISGLAFAAAAALVAVVGARELRTDSAPEQLSATQPAAVGGTAVVPVAATNAPVLTRFVFVAPGARSVSVVGDFNDWAVGATPMEVAGGVWVAEVPLSHGMHEYKFVVNGSEWVADPSAPRSPSSDFGSPNSIITVGGAPR